MYSCPRPAEALSSQTQGGVVKTIVQVFISVRDSVESNSDIHVLSRGYATRTYPEAFREAPLWHAVGHGALSAACPQPFLSILVKDFLLLRVTQNLKGL